MRKAETTLLRAWLHRRWLRTVRDAGFSTTDGSLGVATTGTLDEARLRAMLKRMPQGTWELVCHPGYNDSELAAVRTRLRESREVEMRALLAITARELRDEYGAELVPFGAKWPRPARRCRTSNHNLTSGQTRDLESHADRHYLLSHLWRQRSGGHRARH